MTSRSPAEMYPDLYTDLESLVSSHGYAKVQAALDAIQAMEEGEEEEEGAPHSRAYIDMSPQTNERLSNSRLRLVELGSELTNHILYRNKYPSWNTFCLILTSLQDSDFEDENGFFQHCMLVFQNYSQMLGRLGQQNGRKTKKVPDSICETLDLEYDGSRQSTQAILLNLIIRGGATTGVLPLLDGAIIDRL